MLDVGRNCRVLFINHNCYLDDSNGAAVASRNQMEALARHGFTVEALTGAVLELGEGADPDAWLAGRGFNPSLLGGTWTADAGGGSGRRPGAPPVNRQRRGGHRPCRPLDAPPLARPDGTG